jgi:hypothetical protein
MTKWMPPRRLMLCFWMYRPFCSYHVDLNMDLVVSAVTQLFGLITGVKPKFKVHGGSQAENLALQNIQVSISQPSTSRSLAPRLASSRSWSAFSIQK